MIFFVNLIFYHNNGDVMKVKIFDENHEKDLEEKINNFLEELTGEFIDLKYSVSASIFSGEQVYCFSALIVYSEK